jgi:tetratricopeptide (TPR) repeat protein
VQRWLWVTKPQFWLKLRGVPLDRGRTVEWTCDKRTRRGDVALLYRVDPAKDVAHLFGVDTDDPWLDTHPTDPRRDAWWCEATLLHTLQQPLLLSDLRAESRLDGWAALDFDLHALSFEVPPDVWRVLLRLAHPLDRIALRRYGERPQHRPSPRAEAEARYRDAIAAGDRIAMANLAILIQEDRPKEAEALYRQAIDAGLNTLTPLADLISPERPNEAEALYRQAIETGDSGGLVNLAVLIQRERSGEAEALYRQAISIDARDTVALANLARLIERERPEEAEALYRQAIDARIEPPSGGRSI